MYIITVFTVLIVEKNRDLGKACVSTDRERAIFSQNWGKVCLSTDRERAIFSQNWGKVCLSTDRERAIFSHNWGKVCLSTDSERLFSVRPTVQLIQRQHWTNV